MLVFGQREGKDDQRGELVNALVIYAKLAILQGKKGGLGREPITEPPGQLQGPALRQSVAGEFHHGQLKGDNGTFLKQCMAGDVMLKFVLGRD
ncbi:unnamed protein product [Lampetra fluviatilis]